MLNAREMPHNNETSDSDWESLNDFIIRDPSLNPQPTETSTTGDANLPVIHPSSHSKASKRLSRDNDEIITVANETGIWANKKDAVNWTGDIPIDQYPINEDSSPEILLKKPEQKVNYRQRVAIRYLQPPGTHSAGDVIIHQERDRIPAPAPPIIIRQQPARPETPPPLIIREAPPKLPVEQPKNIIVRGRIATPPPRKVIIERLPPLPPKPQPIIIEKWLPYEQQRRVIFEKQPEPDNSKAGKPKNLIVQWEAPKVEIITECKDLGVMKSNPASYIARYGKELKTLDQMPSFIRNLEVFREQVPPMLKFKGDVEALSLINLEDEGLAEHNPHQKEHHEKIKKRKKRSVLSDPIYSEVVSHMIINPDGKITRNEAKRIIIELREKLKIAQDEEPRFDIELFINSLGPNDQDLIDSEKLKGSLLKAMNESWKSETKPPKNKKTHLVLPSDSSFEHIFSTAVIETKNKIAIGEARRIFSYLNKELDRRYDDNSFDQLLNYLDKDVNNMIDFNEFKATVRSIMSDIVSGSSEESSENEIENQRPLNPLVSPMDPIFSRVFSLLVVDKFSRITRQEAHRNFIYLNEKLSKKYNDKKRDQFLNSLDPSNSGFIDFNDFKVSITNVMTEEPTLSSTTDRSKVAKRQTKKIHPSNLIFTDAFANVLVDENAMITRNEAKRIFIYLNDKLDRRLNEYEFNMLVNTLDPYNGGLIYFSDFKTAIVTSMSGIDVFTPIEKEKSQVPTPEKKTKKKSCDAIFSEVFSTAMVNGNNRITRNEARRLCVYLDEKLEQKNDPEQTSYIINSLDPENSGLVDFDEFKSSIVTIMGNDDSSSRKQDETVDPIFAEVFSKAVVDERNRIEDEEAKRIIIYLSERLAREYSERECDQLINSLDVDNSGLVDFDEFKKSVIDMMSPDVVIDISILI